VAVIRTGILRATVIPRCSRRLDFSKPVKLSSTTARIPDQPLVDGWLSLTGFALIGCPARQDHPRRIEAPLELNRPYMVGPGRLVSRPTQEWGDGTWPYNRCRCPADANPELDGGDRADSCSPAAMTPPARPTPSRPGLEAIAGAGDPLASLRHPKPRRHQKLAITGCPASPPTRGNVGHRGLLRCLSARSTGCSRNEAPGLRRCRTAADFQVTDGSGSMIRALQAHRELAIAHRMSVVVRAAHPLSERLEENCKAPRCNLNSDGHQPAELRAATSAIFLWACSPLRATKAIRLRSAPIVARVQAPTTALPRITPTWRSSGAPNVVLHFGTHGSLEFIAGKQNGHERKPVLPDSTDRPP